MEVLRRIVALILVMLGTIAIWILVVWAFFYIVFVEKEEW